MLAVAHVAVEGRNGSTFANVALDTGAGLTLVARSFVHKLQLVMYHEYAEISGVGDTIIVLRDAVTLRLQTEKGAWIEVPAFVIDEVCGNVDIMPRTALTEDGRLAKGARPRPVRVDVLLSLTETCASLMGQENPIEPIAGKKGLFKLNTHFGTCIAGRRQETYAASLLSGARAQKGTRVSNEELDRRIRFYLEADGFGFRTEEVDPERHAEDVLCESTFASGVRFKPDTQRYEVPMLFKPNRERLWNNSKKVFPRFMALMKKFAHDKVYGEKYKSAMNEYFTGGHARILREEEIPAEEAYYIPHSMVTREDKSTTKHRIVFDASAKDERGVSLNSEIMKPDVVHPPIVGILMRFRLSRVALAADISKMFLQMELKPEDRKYHRFFWQDERGNVAHCEMSKMTFGVTDSPYKAMATVKHHVAKYKDRYPEAAKALSRNLYVDDYIGGADSEEDAIELRRQCSEILSTAGMTLSKWNSNAKAVLQSVPVGLRAKPKEGPMLLTANLRDEDAKDVHAEATALGIQWMHSTDKIVYTGWDCRPRPQPPITKRKMASYAAAFFDPVGFACPATITAKILLQETWDVSPALDWDTEVPQELAERWNKWIDSLEQLKHFALPRCVIAPAVSHGNVTEKTLHVFGDASEKAMGAAAYLVTRYESGQTRSHLLTAAARVHKREKHTLARKELNAAVLAAQLAKNAGEECDLQKDHTYLYTDSLTTMQWLRKDSNTWKQYVKNRCDKVHHVVTEGNFLWCPGVDNPADIPSRGLSIAGNELWTIGPPWLWDPRQKKADEPTQTPDDAQLHLEMKRALIGLAATCAKAKMHPQLNRLWGISDYDKFLRITAYLIKFRQRRRGAVQPRDLKSAERWWIRSEQYKMFTEEVTDLKAGREIHIDSALKSLAPFLDKDGLLRVGGRMELTDAPYEEKHPVIVPAGSVRTATDMHKSMAGRLVLDRHLKHLHAGPMWLQNHLRKEYWIMKARNLTRSVVQKCVPCQKAIKPRMEQKMAQLPPDRFEAGRPWDNVGVDYTGHFYLAEDGGEAYKVYVCIFTDLTTRAVHLELCPGMTVEHFLRAFRRFISRRGVPSRLRSDEARNFKRAQHELRQLFTLSQTPETKNELSRRKIRWDWVLNTPHSPWRGGTWERLIGTAKSTLRKVLGAKTVDQDTFQTVLAEVEAIMNDRPLCAVRQDVTSYDPVTPAQLTQGRDLSCLPPHQNKKDGEEADPAQNGRKTISRLWEERQKLQKSAWDRFYRDYMAETLTKMPKWTKEKPSIKVGDLVLVTTENKRARGEWPLARVTEIELGKSTRQGPVRTVTVKLSNGRELQRSIQQLVHLEID